MLIKKEVHVLTDKKVNRIQKDGNVLATHSDHEKLTEADIILIAAGAGPSVELILKTGIQLGATGAITINEKMEYNK